MRTDEDDDEEYENEFVDDTEKTAHTQQDHSAACVVRVIHQRLFDAVHNRHAYVHLIITQLSHTHTHMGV